MLLLPPNANARVFFSQRELAEIRGLLHEGADGTTQRSRLDATSDEERITDIELIEGVLAALAACMRTNGDRDTRFNLKRHRDSVGVVERHDFTVKKTVLLTHNPVNYSRTICYSETGGGLFTPSCVSGSEARSTAF